MGNPRRRFLDEVAAAGLPSEPGPAGPVSDANLAALPAAVQRYLRFMNVVGRPRDWAFQLEFTGRFRRRPADRWMACHTWQYNTRLAVARIFYIRARLAGLVPVLDRFTVQDGKSPEYDITELVTYLNDNVERPRSRGRRASARRCPGAPLEFSTTDRFCADSDDAARLMRARRTTPVDAWTMTEDGRRVPAGAQATFQLPRGPFTYAEFRPVPGTLAFNRAPGT
jgi:uncharacterized protein DUF6544